ncbi:hypothetical protein GCM10027035_17900 [Emticicia sediminis]
MKISNFNFTKRFFDNLPINLKTQSDLDINILRKQEYEEDKLTYILPTIGLSYVINKRIGVISYYELNSYETITTKFSSNKVFIGGLITLN